MPKSGPTRSVLAALAVLLLAASVGCRARRSHAQVLADLVVTTEALANEIGAARSLKDLESREKRLKALASRARRLRRESHRLGPAPKATLARYEPRVRKALERVAQIQVEWSRQGRWRMLRFVDSL